MILDLTACDGQTNICQMAKEMSGTLTSIPSMRLSFVNRSKQLIKKTRSFTRLVSITLVAELEIIKSFSIGKAKEVK